MEVPSDSQGRTEGQTEQQGAGFIVQHLLTLDLDLEGARVAVLGKLHASRTPLPPRKHEPKPTRQTSCTGVTRRAQPTRGHPPSSRCANLVPLIEEFWPRSQGRAPAKLAQRPAQAGSSRLAVAGRSTL